MASETVKYDELVKIASQLDSVALSMEESGAKDQLQLALLELDQIIGELEAEIPTSSKVALAAQLTHYHQPAKLRAIASRNGHHTDSAVA